MGWIEAGSGSGPITVLEDFVKYPAKVAKVELTEPGTYGRRVAVFWQLSEDPEDLLRCSYGLKVGKQKDGTVSKLRAMLNAVAGMPEKDEVAFNDETFEFRTSDGKVHTLGDGSYVVIVGKHETNDEGKVYYNVMSYLPVKRSGAARPAATPKPAPAPATADDDEIPF